MTVFALALMTLAVGLTACDEAREDGAPGETLRLVGYLHGARGADVRDVDAAKLTHLNYAFANVRNDSVVLESPDDPANLARLTALRAGHPELRILLSVGGWSWSEHFSDAALTEASRETFAQSAAALMTRFALDGLDVDWEYPGQPGEDNVYREADRENFTLLLRTLREHLDRQSDRDGRAEGRRYELTIAAGAGAAYLAHTDLRAAAAYLDFINLMTYDFHGAWTDRTGHHANLYPPSGVAAASGEAAVEALLRAGVPARKIVLGAAFYGRGWRGVRPENHGLYQPYEGRAESYPFHALADRYIDKNGYERHWDDAAKAPYLWHPDSLVFISYEDEASLREKGRYVRAKGLGGVMYWEHTGDADGTLLNALYEALRP
ncbi:glycoside hydrolase family 18 protein [Rhodocaloribacter sp.]